MLAIAEALNTERAPSLEWYKAIAETEEEARAAYELQVARMALARSEQ